MNTCYAALFEAVSIQNYIFQNNTLKTNLGASHLIQHEIFETYLKQAVIEIFGKAYGSSWDAWKEIPSDIRISKALFEVGYIGGGNALLLFQNEDSAKKVINFWSRLLLIQTPGIQTAVAIDAFDTDRFKESLDNLVKKLQMNKSRYNPQIVIPRHGITGECRQSGLSAEFWEKNEMEFVSSVTAAKISAAKSARYYFQEKFKAQLQEKYCFPDQLEKLGSISGEDSHIAIVHIDGNRMGKRFQDADSLQAIRELSLSVHQATMDAFSGLINCIVQDYEIIMKDSLWFDPYNKDPRFWFPMDEEYNRKRLPIAPIVLGGDDVTFVCDGKLGIYLAKQFIEALEKKQVSDKKKLTASAGIAIIKVKYPFYRGYSLSEELCSNAKKLNKNEYQSERLISTLDFHVSMSGVFGKLDQIREKHFRVPEGNLLFRPYKIVPADTGDEKNLDQMIVMASKLKEGFPKSKIKTLQSILSRSKIDHEEFVAEIKFRSRSLPAMPGRKFHETIFDNVETIYFDMIELTEFYPRHKLTEKEAA